MDDIKIVSLYRQRNEQAIAETAEKYGAYCFKISMNILSDASDSEEIVNDAYMQVWNSIPPNSPKVLSAYIGKLTRNLALNRYKARHTQKRQGDEFALSLSELDNFTPSGLSVEDEAGIAELSRSINRFLHKQPPEARRVFVRRYFYSDSVADIAKLYGFGESKVKSLLMRTRARLRTELEKEGYYGQ